MGSLFAEIEALIGDGVYVGVGGLLVIVLIIILVVVFLRR